MRLVDFISGEKQLAAAKISTHDERFLVSKLVSIKTSAKLFFLNEENYTGFAP